MAHLLRCVRKGRDYDNRLQRGARPAADASSKRPRCGEDGSAARPERRPESGPSGEVLTSPLLKHSVRYAPRPQHRSNGTSFTMRAKRPRTPQRFCLPRETTNFVELRLGEVPEHDVDELQTL